MRRVFFAFVAMFSLFACSDQQKSEPKDAREAPSTSSDSLMATSFEDSCTDSGLSLDVESNVLALGDGDANQYPRRGWNCKTGCPAGTSGPFALTNGGGNICCPAGTNFAGGYGSRGGECIPKPAPPPSCTSNGTGNAADVVAVTNCCSAAAKKAALYNQYGTCAPCCSTLPAGKRSGCESVCGNPFKKLFPGPITF
jgi:hypothetical protein